MGGRLVDRPIGSTVWKLERRGFVTVPGHWIGRRPRRRDTGQRVRQTVGTLTGKLTLDNGSRTLWEDTICQGNPHHVNAETINEQTVREEMFRWVRYLISTLKIPSFVPTDPDPPRLPIVQSTD